MPPFVDSLIVLAAILIVSRFVKRGSRTLQHLFIPSALVAGLAGLILGPQVLGTITSDVTYYWNQLPRHLINIVFAGLFLGRVIPGRRELWKSAGPMVAFGSTIAWGQYVLGIGLTMLLLTPVFGVNPLAGALIEISFAGGHGTAAGLAPTFEQLGWSEGTDIALALATLSIFVAVISGIVMINIHHRRTGKANEEGWDEQRKQLVRGGYNLISFTQRVNTNPKAVAINAVAFGLAIGIGWIILQGLVRAEEFLLSGFTDVRFFAFLPLFPLAMIGGLIVQLVLRKLKRQHFIQRRTAEIFSAIALDLLIASAIATVSLNAIGNNMPVFVVFGVAGIFWIVACLFWLAPRMFRNKHWFEYGITDYGQAMGMTATGLLMNRLADPTNTLKIRESFAYKQLIFEPFLGGGIVTATSVVVIYQFGSVFALVTAAIATLAWLVVGLRIKAKQV
jgi:ESS family glutamate:Na+ symporter